MSSGRVHGIQAVLDNWRERGADRVDPVRFHFIEAMAKRAAGQSGEARHLLDERLTSLLQAYESDLQASPSDVFNAGKPASTEAEVDAGARRPLAELNAYLARQAPTAYGTSTTAPSTHARRDAYPELPDIDYFRKTWARVSTGLHLKQSLEHVPQNAGPLNSSNLVHRSLSLMRELAPDYLHHFLSYVDALSWMEQLKTSGATASKEPRAANVKRNARSRRP